MYSTPTYTLTTGVDMSPLPISQPTPPHFETPGFTSVHIQSCRIM